MTTGKEIWRLRKVLFAEKGTGEARREVGKWPKREGKKRLERAVRRVRKAEKILRMRKFGTAERKCNGRSKKRKRRKRGEKGG